MTLKRSDLVKSIIDRVHLKPREKTRQQFLFPELNYTPLSKNQARKIINSMFEIMKTALEKGDYVLFTGFGRFSVKFKWARKGRNPKTGEKVFLKSRRVVVFKSSKKLKEKINFPNP